MQDIRRKALHYRHSVLLPTTSESIQSLQQRLEAAYRIQNSVKDRCHFCDETMSGQPDVTRDAHMFISEAETVQEMWCGEIMYVEPGTSVPIIATNYDEPSIRHEALTKDVFSEDWGREFLDSVAYIGVLENHVVVMQSKAISVKDIVEYINVFLRSSGVIESHESVLFQANNYVSDEGGLAGKNVKSVNLTIPLSKPNSYQNDDALRILETLIGDSRMRDIESLFPDNVADLKLDISLGYKYNTTYDNEKILTALARGLVDNRDEELVISLKDAGKLIGDQVQLKVDKNIVYRDGLPVKGNVYERMVEWLIYLFEKGLINP